MALITHRSALIEAIDPTPGADVTPAPAPSGRGLKQTWARTHPDCAECCATRLCHFCLQPSRSDGFGGDGYVSRVWDDGYTYGACRRCASLLQTAIAGEIAAGAVIAGRV